MEKEQEGEKWMIENFVEIKEAAVKIDTRTYRMKLKKKKEHP